LRPAPIRFPSSKRSLDPDGPFVCRGRKPSSPVSSRKHPLGLSPQGFSGQIGPLEGRAPHARKGQHWLQGGFSPLGSRPPADASGGNEMPRHQYSLATRTHRVRPSEKTAPRVISGFSPQGHLTLARPPEGRAPHARKEGPGLTEVGRHGPMATGAPILGNGRPRHPYGLATRTRRARPSEKIAHRAISGPSSARPSRLGQLTPRRGGLRTPVMSTSRQPKCCLFLATNLSLARP
jgi:hypothetical protein